MTVGLGRPLRCTLGALALAALAACGDDPAPAPSAPFLPSAAQVAAHNQALGLVGKFEFEDAVPRFDALLEEAPRWHDARVNLAIALLNSQDEPAITRAMNELVAVLTAEPRHLRARFMLGLLKLYRGDVKGSLPLLEAVATADAADAYAASWVAAALAALDQNEKALAWYRKAIALDPLMRSAYYGAFQALQLLDRMPEAEPMMEEFQRLETHPLVHSAQLRYTRMGPKAMAGVGEAKAADPVMPTPGGRYFAEKAEPLPVRGRAVTWNATPGPATSVDIDADGFQDLFLQDAEMGPYGAKHLLLRGSAAGFTAVDGHVLESVADVNAVLWGDLDNDGRVDAYFCRKGENALFLQREGGRFEDVTAPSRVGGGAFHTVDGLLADLDHDGDLDIYAVNVDGSNELFSNNLDGTFRPLGALSGVAGNGKPSVAALAADLDADRDLDLVVLHVEPPHEVFWNDRLWAWTKEPGALAAFVAPSHDPNAVCAADTDADGFPELYAGDGIHLERWARGRDGRYARELHWDLPHLGGAVDAYKPMPIAVADLDGDGVPDIITARDGRFLALRPHEPYHVETLKEGPGTWSHILLASIDSRRGPVLVRTRPSLPPDLLVPAGPSHRWAGLAFSGKNKESDQMRSNASGIGVRAVVQVGSRGTVLSNQRVQSGPGQSLQPLFAGLGPAERIDFVTLLWPDGLLQTETNLDAGKVHRIEEVQRQTSSCPVLFCWDGTKHAFVTDLLGVGGIGFFVGPGEYAPSLPREHVLLPVGLPVPKDGRYVLKVSEPMEETCYLDRADLVAWDLPPGVSLVLDERMGVLGPAPTSEPRFFTHERAPSRAFSNGGEDVTALVRSADHRAAPVGELDTRFLGRTKGSVLTLEFAELIDVGPGAPTLVADGWIEYPYAQTVFAAWQAGASYLAPTLEARGADGAWKTVQMQFGYPAGMPRTMSFPLLGLPRGTNALRLSGTHEVYWDRIVVAYAEPCPEAVRRALPRTKALLEAGGFAKRTTGPQRLPHYDWEKRKPFWDCRHQRGLYTRLGDVETLLAATDDAVVVFGPGEDVHLEYSADLSPLPAGWTRRFVLETSGWCKDMDLYTKDGDTVGPLPLRDGFASTPSRDALHAGTLTRPGR